jgi:hypothetical protein
LTPLAPLTDDGEAGLPLMISSSVISSYSSSTRPSFSSGRRYGDVGRLADAGAGLADRDAAEEGCREWARGGKTFLRKKKRPRLAASRCWARCILTSTLETGI